MGFLYLVAFAFFTATIAPSGSSPIMVKFGTKGGPIVPPTAPPSTASPRSYNPPAPVHEYQEDIPNPSTYRPIQPHQYRTKIYKYRPNPNLILGTPLDKKYTPGFDKYSVYRKPRKTIGAGYTGPQFFEVQDYEREDPKYQTVELFQPAQQNFNSFDRRNTVPEIGVVYSSGVRYYVPQITYYGGYDDIDNSVYEANDIKYYQGKVRNY